MLQYITQLYRPRSLPVFCLVKEIGIWHLHWALQSIRCQEGDNRIASIPACDLLLLRVEGLLEGNTKLLAYRLKLLKVLGVLALVLHLELDTCDVC